MLSKADLVHMRSTQREYMPEVCSIMREVREPDGAGGYEPNRAIVASDVPCRMTTRTGQETVIGDRVTRLVEYVMSVPHDTKIRASDTVLYAGKAFEVTSVSENSWKTAQRLRLART